MVASAREGNVRVLAVGLAFAIAADQTIQPTPDNIEVRQELINFLETDWFVKNAGKDANTFDLFEEGAKYPLGIIRRTEGKVDPPPTKNVYSDTENIYCGNKANIESGGFRASDGAVVKDHKGEWTVDGGKGTVWNPILNRPGDSKETLMWCYALAGTENYTVEDVVAYELKQSATTLHYLKAIGWALGAAAVAWLILSTIYYRGLVYIVCGPRKQSASAGVQIQSL